MISKVYKTGAPKKKKKKLPKKWGQIKPLPKGSLEFLKRFRDSDKWELVPPQRKGIITQSINKRRILNNKHLQLINKILKDLKGIKDILDVSDLRLQYTGKYKSKSKSNKKTISKQDSNNPFDVYWQAPKGNSKRKNWELYMKTAIWKAKRKYILEKRGNRCQKYGCEQPIRAKSKLHCHHLTYKRLGCEEENDIQIQCEPCHNKTHKENTIFELEKDFAISNYIDGVDYMTIIVN